MMSFCKQFCRNQSTYNGDAGGFIFSVRAFRYHSCANDTNDLTSCFGISQRQKLPCRMLWSLYKLDQMPIVGRYFGFIDTFLKNHRDAFDVSHFCHGNTYKMNSGVFRTLNRFAVFTPRTSLSTRATFTRLRRAAPTASHTADNR